MAKYLSGIVTSDVRDKSITVAVTSRETHPIYKKQYSITRKYQAHDEKNQANKGDKVTIIAVRPISKTKSFTLDHIDEKSRGSLELKDESVTVEKIVKPQVDEKSSKKAAEEKKS